MRLRLLLAFCMLPFLMVAQNMLQPAAPLQLATGKQTLLPASSAAALKSVQEKTFWDGRYIWLATFHTPPSGAVKNRWQQEGFRLLSKISANAYFVSTDSMPGPLWMESHGIQHVAAPDPSLKLEKSIVNGKIPADATDGADMLHALVSLHPSIPLAPVKEWLAKNKVYVDPGFLGQDNRVVAARLPVKKIQELASQPFVFYIQPIRKDKPLNEKARFFVGAGIAHAPLSLGGYNLTGEGVVVGVGDFGDGSLHPDMDGRIINHSGGYSHDHGANVTGIVAGGGLLQSDRKGMAPKATVINQYLSGIWQHAAEYVQDYGMVLTNNSFGNTNGECATNGSYDAYSQWLDQQAIDLPELLQVFAAGNSGEQACTPYPYSYNTILAGFQTAKNVVTVGRTDYNILTHPSSSSGPTLDGRLKPEITTLGVVESTNRFAGYVGAHGTSQSAPAVTGGLALLYEQYRKLHGGSNPQGALMKSILLNGARDIGTPGPDFRHGYGIMNLENSLRILSNHYYFEGNLSAAGSKDTVVNVPASTAQLKVMLYWHDPAANPLAPNALVNDLDLEVTLPDGTTVIYPKKLNTSPASVAMAATEGPDHINNSEQVVIETPIPGPYTIRVKSYDVTGSQPFYTAFDFVPQELRIVTPLEGETWARFSPDQWAVLGVVISWNDEGTPNDGTYTLEYSLDNGANWFPITSTLKDTARYYGWVPPDGTATNEAKVRITKNSTSFTHTSQAFSILGRPLSLSVTNPCPGYISLSWAAVTGAEIYEVIMKKGQEMVPVATVTPPTTSYTMGGLSVDSNYYMGVRAVKGGIAGRYVQIPAIKPSGGTCAGTVSDGDLKLDSITAPLSGRQATSSQLGASETLQIRIKNLDNAAVAAGSYDVKYSLDGGPYISIAPGSAPAIAALGTANISFTGLDLSAVGHHTIQAIVKNTATDNVPANDTFNMVVKNLPNPLITPTDVPATSFVENFEASPVATYNSVTVGLTGLDHWDYGNNHSYARARSFVYSGIAFSGNRAITLDVSKEAANAINVLQGTFNLSGNTTADEVRLDFKFKKHGQFQLPDAQNKVWVRGSDVDNWIEAYNLGTNQPTQSGVWKTSSSLEINDLLANAFPPQTFTSSAQVRIGQKAPIGMADDTNSAGYTFDDLRIYLATNDMQLLMVNEPLIYSCGLTASTPIKITLRNSMGTALTNVPVSFTVDGLSYGTELIPSIAANSSFEYTFSTTANLSAPGTHEIEATVNYPGDNVTDNNMASVVVINQPVISSFPYLQDFEVSDGNFYTTGSSSSWQWGVPASAKINTAPSGTKVWKTNLTGTYNNNESSYLYSPCFNISSLTNPTLSFSFAYDIEDCGASICDIAWVEYSTNGTNWSKLGTAAQGTNWYNNAIHQGWMKENQTHWHVATLPIPTASTQFQFRFVLSTDGGLALDGLAIDDIHIYSLPMPMYTSIGTSAAVTQPLSGILPVHFSDGGKLIATINPNANNLGNTEVRAYIYGGGVRNYAGLQYYGNRNITIKPGIDVITPPVTVRYYFSNKEVDDLRLANTCSGCTQIVDYTKIGVTQYSGTDEIYEDGSLENNLNGINIYIKGNDIRLVPYDSGYYAEFDVTHFSEFWLNDGRDSNIPLPGRWINLSATKQLNWATLLEWSSANGYEARYFEVQVARSKELANSGLFETIYTRQVSSNPQQVYSYSDERPDKNGDYYYRIKQVGADGSVLYSPVRWLRFGSRQFDITLRPNPVKDRLIINIHGDEARQLQVRVLNMAGQVLHTQAWPVAAGSSHLAIPVQKLGLAKGMYTVAIGDGKNWWYGKVVKE